MEPISAPRADQGNDIASARKNPANRYLSDSRVPGIGDGVKGFHEREVAFEILAAEARGMLAEVAGSFAWTQGCLTPGNWLAWLEKLPIEQQT